RGRVARADPRTLRDPARRRAGAAAPAGRGGGEGAAGGRADPRDDVRADGLRPLGGRPLLRGRPAAAPLDSPPRKAVGSPPPPSGGYRIVPELSPPRSQSGARCGQDLVRQKGPTKPGRAYEKGNPARSDSGCRRRGT